MNSNNNQENNENQNNSENEKLEFLISSLKDFTSIWKIKPNKFYVSIKTNNSRGIEYKIINQKTGQEKWVHGLGNLTFDENRNPVEMFGTIQDITERKHMEQALIESEEKFRSIFHSQKSGLKDIL